MKAQWPCRRCRGKFKKYADFKYHICEPAIRPKRRPTKRRKHKVD